MVTVVTPGLRLLQGQVQGAVLRPVVAAVGGGVLGVPVRRRRRRSGVELRQRHLHRLLFGREIRLRFVKNPRRGFWRAFLGDRADFAREHGGVIQIIVLLTRREVT